MQLYRHPACVNRMQLFLSFEGPATLLLQSRASHLSDVLTLRDVNEIAESPPGAVQDVVTRNIREEMKEIAATGTTPPLASTDAAGTVKSTIIKEPTTVKDARAEPEKSST
jgi:hypothetical protein